MARWGNGAVGGADCKRKDSAVTNDFTLAGGTYVEVPADQAVVDEAAQLVTAPAWPGDTAILAEFVKLLGAKIEI